MSGDSEKSSPTLRQIAREAGVALSTASAALRGRPGASKATAEHVREVAERMGWRPNPLISAWLSHVRQGQPPADHGTLAYMVDYESGIDVLFNDPKRFIHRAYWKGARDRAKRRGFDLQVFDAHNLSGKRLSNIFRTRNIHGVILAPKGQTTTVIDFDWSLFACAAIAYSTPQFAIHRAANHHFHTVTLCLENLHRLGYRRIGLAIPESTNDRSSGMFFGGYLAGMYSLPNTTSPRPFLPQQCDYTRERFHQWLKKEEPDVVMGIHTSIPDWLAELGYKTPRDIGYIHLDLPPEEEKIPQVEYAGIDQQSEKVGAAAVDLVTAQLDRNERGLPESVKVSLVESRWVDGPSVKKRKKK